MAMRTDPAGVARFLIRIARRAYKSRPETCREQQWQCELSRRALAPVPHPELPAGHTSPAPETLREQQWLCELSRRALARFPTPNCRRAYKSRPRNAPRTTMAMRTDRRALARFLIPNCPHGIQVPTRNAPRTTMATRTEPAGVSPGSPSGIARRAYESRPRNAPRTTMAIRTEPADASPGSLNCRPVPTTIHPTVRR